MPVGWSRCFQPAGSPESDYLLRSDADVHRSGGYSVMFVSKGNPSPNASAGICQLISAAAFKGQVVTVAVHLRTRDAPTGAHLVFRAEAADGRLLRFFNMEPNWVRGTQDWTRQSTVIDLPAAAAVLIFGATLEGSGTMWLDDAGLEVLPGGSPGAQPVLPEIFNPRVSAASLPNALVNAGFEEIAARSLVP